MIAHITLQQTVFLILLGGFAAMILAGALQHHEANRANPFDPRVRDRKTNKNRR